MIPKNKEIKSNFGTIEKLKLPKNLDDIAFYTIPQLHALIKSKKDLCSVTCEDFLQSSSSRQFTLLQKYCGKKTFFLLLYSWRRR